MGNSFNAHRLLHLADQHSFAMQNALSEVLFRRFYGEGQNPGETSCLADAAVEVGLLDREKAVEFLESDKGAAEVQALLEIPRKKRINGVPFFHFPNVEMSGAQAEETFVEILTDLAKKN